MGPFHGTTPTRLQRRCQYYELDGVYCIGLGHQASAILLLEKAANVDLTRSGDTPTALHMATRSGDGDIVRMLLSQAADPNLELEDYLPSPRTRTALKLTAIGGFTAIARILLESGADVNVQPPPAGYDKVTTGMTL